MTLYAVVALGDLGIIVHIYFSDTDVLVLTLRTVPKFSAQSAMMMGTEELNDALSNSSLSTMPWVLTRQAALPGFQTLIGAYINGHRTQEIRKPTYFNMFLKVSDDVISALGGFWVGM